MARYSHGGWARLIAIWRLDAALDINPMSSVIGMSLAVLIVLALLVVGVLVMRAAGPPTLVYGRVTGLSVDMVGRYQNWRRVQVDVDGRSAYVSDLQLACRVGDRIELRRWRALLGYSYQSTYWGCVQPRPHRGRNS